MIDFQANHIEFDQIPGLTDDELKVCLATARLAYTRINNQLIEWNGNHPDDLRDQDWADRARKAQRHVQLLLSNLKLEITKRFASKRLVSKASAHDRGHAFVKAAKLHLTDEELETIWQLAMERYPDAFTPTQP